MKVDDIIDLIQNHIEDNEGFMRDAKNAFEYIEAKGAVDALCRLQNDVMEIRNNDTDK